ncbi:ABC transporter permease [Helicobacter suis]|uniref:ABC transporter permease n=1 Tax=Helicobacter suis TaxID=104628 RepID=UPI0013D3891B|nr:ABC transporter permease [Helicobacter suis]
MIKALAQEFKAIFTNFAVLFIIIGGPLFYAFLYPLPYKNDIVTHQKIALVDKDQSFLSYKLTQLLEATQEMSIAYFPSSLQEAKKLLEEEKVYGIVFIPEFFEKHVYTGVPASVEFYANANYFLIYGAIAQATLSTIQDLSHKIKIDRERFLTNQSGEHELFSLQTIPLYNYSLGYLNYALSHVLLFILHQTLLIGTAILTTTTPKCFPNLLESLSFILIRCFCFSFIYLFLVLLYLGVLFTYYGIHTHANPLALLIFAMIFIFSTASCGVLLGTFLSKPVQATQIVLLSSLPLIFMMGFIWPAELMPSFLQILLQVVPATHALSGMVMLNQMGANLSVVIKHIGALMAISLVALSWSAWRLRGIKHA